MIRIQMLPEGTTSSVMRLFTVITMRLHRWWE